jgi:hypothetical protein
VSRSKTNLLASALRYAEAYPAIRRHLDGVAGKSPAL